MKRFIIKVVPNQTNGIEVCSMPVVVTTKFNLMSLVKFIMLNDYWMYFSQKARFSNSKTKLF